MTDASRSPMRQAATGVIVSAALIWFALAVGIIDAMAGQFLLLIITTMNAVKLFRRGRSTENCNASQFFFIYSVTLVLLMLWAIAQLILTELNGGEVPLPSAADVVGVLAYLFGIAGLLVLLRSSKTANLRSLLDGLLLSAGVFFASWVLVLEGLVRSSSYELPAVIVLSTYNGLDIVALSIAALVAVRRSPFGRTLTLTATSSLIILTLGDVTYLAVTLGQNVPEWLPVALWNTSALTLALTTVAPITVAEKRSDKPTLMSVVLPYATPVIITSLGAYYWQQNERISWVLVVTTAAALFLLFARQGFALIDNLNLNRTLENAVEDLQERERQLQESERRLHHAAHHDALTGLANRRLFYDRLTDAITAPNTYSAVLILDLDDFKVLNDTHGHQAGDELLSEVAERLQATTRPGDVVARLGGDEFAVLLSGVDELAARRVAERISVAMLEEPTKSRIPVSIGFAALEGALTEEEALRRADEAMYECKRKGKSGLKYYVALPS